MSITETNVWNSNDVLVPGTLPLVDRERCFHLPWEAYLWSEACVSDACRPEYVFILFFVRNLVARGRIPCLVGTISGAFLHPVTSPIEKKLVGMERQTGKVATGGHGLDITED
jgi:hypothetical protein